MSDSDEKEDFEKLPGVNEIYNRYIDPNLLILHDQKPVVLFALFECWKNSRLEGYQAGKDNAEIRYNIRRASKIEKVTEFINSLNEFDKNIINERIKGILDND